MNHARASGAPLTISLGGTKRTLRRLSRRDFGVIIERMPVDQDRRIFISPFDVHRWAGTLDGSVVVLAVASLPVGYSPEQLDARIEAVGGESGDWGSQIQKVTVAALVTGESLVSGEEDEEAAPAEGKKRSDPTSTNGTTRTKPGLLRRMLPGWAIRGT